MSTAVKQSKQHVIIAIACLDALALKELAHFGDILRSVVNIHIIKMANNNFCPSLQCHKVKEVFLIGNLTKNFVVKNLLGYC